MRSNFDSGGAGRVRRDGHLAAVGHDGDSVRRHPRKEGKKHFRPGVRGREEGEKPVAQDVNARLERRRGRLAEGGEPHEHELEAERGRNAPGVAELKLEQPSRPTSNQEGEQDPEKNAREEEHGLGGQGADGERDHCCVLCRDEPGGEPTGACVQRVLDRPRGPAAQRQDDIANKCLA